jgi:hypothetical protein
MSQIMFSDLENIISPVHTVVSVGNTNTAVVAANPYRRYLLLVNDSDEKIYIKLGATAVLSQGIPIAPGASYEISPAKSNLYKGAINGICTTGGKNLLVTEG